MIFSRLSKRWNLIRYLSNQKPPFSIEEYLKNNPNIANDKKLSSEIILNAKQRSEYSFADLAKMFNVNKVWLTSAILGQHPINKDISQKLIQTLNISGSEEELEKLTQNLEMVPKIRGLATMDSKMDPTIRRFHELLDVYGDTFKMLIQEELGDGIMSAIDCSIQFEKQIINDEQRIVIMINGKYLQYKN